MREKKVGYLVETVHASNDDSVILKKQAKLGITCSTIKYFT
jgi:hypothetical protein